MNRRTIYILTGLGFCAMVSLSHAQSVEYADPRTMGMARASMVSARGLDAVGLNPANLGFDDRSTISISLFPIGVRAGSNFFTWNTFEKYFSGVKTDSGTVGRYLTDADKQDILNEFTSGKGIVTGGGAFTLFALSFSDPKIGGIAFTINERFGASATIPRDYLRLLFYGNPLGSRYEFSETSASGQWVREYALSYGRTLPSFVPMTTIAAGVSLKLIQGYAYGGVDRFTASVATSPLGAISGTASYRVRRSTIDAIADTGKTNASPFDAPAGSGFGLDVGLTARIGKAFRAGLSVVDVGSIQWSRNAKEYVADASVTLTDPTSKAQRDSITDAFKGKEYDISSFDTQLPTTVRIGFGVTMQQLPVFSSMPGQMVVEIDYIQGTNTSVGNTTAPRFALGIDYHPVSWVPIRTGLGFGGNERVHWGFGTGFNFSNFDLEIGTEDIIALLAPGSMSTASFAFGMRLRF